MLSPLFRWARRCISELSATVDPPKLEACREPPVVSNELMTEGMEAVIDELEIHFGHLSNPKLSLLDRDAIGRNAGEGVRRGLTLIGIHQYVLKVQLDDLLVASFPVESDA